jgi:hypothetical protein
LLSNDECYVKIWLNIGVGTPMELGKGPRKNGRDGAKKFTGVRDRVSPVWYGSALR